MLRYHYTESNELGKRLHRVRKASGMTLEDLADALNKEFGTHANKGTISKYENGIHEPNASTVYCLAKILGISVDFLMGKTDLDYPSLMASLNIHKDSGDKRTSAGKAAAAAGKIQEQPDAGDEKEDGGGFAKPSIYSYDMPDNSMSPRYKIGDVLIIRTDVPIVSGRICLVQYRKNHPMVRQLIIDRQKWVLKPENRAFDQLELKFDPDVSTQPKDLKVIGKVIEFRRCETDSTST
jgi:transcriptional regulator with XRE-family HTH domain